MPSDDGFDDAHRGVENSMHARGGEGLPKPSTEGVTCRSCGQEGHFSKDCPDRAEGSDACFNCGQEGHNKADCPNERAFTGTCRFCEKEGHMAKDCPDKPIELCKNCGKEGHKVAQCTAARAVDFSEVETKTADDGWTQLVEADKDRDLDDVRDAVMVYVKAVPTTTYLELEKAFRSLVMNTYLIAYEKEVTDTFTLMDLQGNLDRKYTVGYFLNAKAQRGKMKEGWPESPEENLTRLEHAGIPVDRKIPKCSNCEKLGHIAKSCTEDARERSDKVEVRCVNCDDVGHRVRDCPKPRKDRFACRNCGQPGHKAEDCTEPRNADNVECRHCNEKGHFAKDCPQREPETCRNCGEEGHRSKECTNERNPALTKCRNCDEMGHMSKECPKPRDYSRVQCQNCNEMGHTKVRCKQPIADAGGDGGAPDTNGDGGYGGGSGGGFETSGFDEPAAAAAGSGDW